MADDLFDDIAEELSDDLKGLESRDGGELYLLPVCTDTRSGGNLFA